MITTIDAAGRVVIPKPVREAMGLTPGAKIDVSFSDGSIQIEYAPVEAWVRIADDGLPIIETSVDGLQPLTDEVLERAKEEMYRDRFDHLGGL